MASGVEGMHIFLPFKRSLFQTAEPLRVATSMLPEESSIYTFSFSMGCILRFQPSFSQTAMASSTSSPQ